jgi:hypothetical protein
MNDAAVADALEEALGSPIGSPDAAEGQKKSPSPMTKGL